MTAAALLSAAQLCQRRPCAPRWNWTHSEDLDMKVAALRGTISQVEKKLQRGLDVKMRGDNSCCNMLGCGFGGPAESRWRRSQEGWSVGRDWANPRASVHPWAPWTAGAFLPGLRQEEAPWGSFLSAGVGSRSPCRTCCWCDATCSLCTRVLLLWAQDALGVRVCFRPPLSYVGIQYLFKNEDLWVLFAQCDSQSSHCVC